MWLCCQNKCESASLASLETADVNIPLSESLPDVTPESQNRGLCFYYITFDPVIFGSTLQSCECTEELDMTCMKSCRHHLHELCLPVLDVDWIVDEGVCLTLARCFLSLFELTEKNES